MEPEILDTLYRIASEKTGWLSKLQTHCGISGEDTRYLEWLDGQEQETKKKVTQISHETEEDSALELSKVNAHIKAIEVEAQKYSGEEKFLFLGLSELDELASKRWKLRNRLLSSCLPNREVLLTDDEIERARQVPLYKVIRNLPKNRFILCPSHNEKSPSFKVFERGYCFGCGFTMDSIAYIMNSFGYSFIQAVKFINSNW